MEYPTYGYWWAEDLWALADICVLMALIIAIGSSMQDAIRRRRVEMAENLSAASICVPVGFVLDPSSLRRAVVAALAGESDKVRVLPLDATRCKVKTAELVLLVQLRRAGQSMFLEVFPLDSHNSWDPAVYKFAERLVAQLVA